VKILIADDHPMIRTAIEVLLRDTGLTIAGSATTGAEAMRALDELKPDLLLLDLQMPEGSGMDVLRAVRSSGRRLRVVLLTAGIEDPALMEAHALEVDGMVLKNSDPAFLIECLDAVRAGRSWIDPELRDRIAALGERVPPERPPLAPRERELIKHVRQGLRNREIAKELGVTEGTVKVYLHNVFDKLGVKNRTELAIRADEFLAGSFIRPSRP
jgi:two-component system, NarL family, nitrate/nitrite response regulator NarL